MSDGETILYQYCKNKNIEPDSIPEDIWEQVANSLDSDLNTYMQEVISENTFNEECWMYLKQKGFKEY